MADKPSTVLPDRIALTAILLTGMGLGVCGIGWGLPSSARVNLLGDDLDTIRSQIATTAKDGGSVVIAEPEQGAVDLPRAFRRYFLYTHHPDEMLTLMALSKIRPARFDFHPHLFQYGGLFLYPLGAMLFVGEKLGLVELKPDLNYYLRQPERFGRLYIVGRLFVASLVAATALLIYGFARKICDPFSAWLGATWFLLSPATITFSHEMKPHAAAGFFVLLSLYWLFSWVAEARSATLWRSAVACGAAAAMVITNQIFLLAVLCCIWLVHGLSIRERVRKTAMCCALATAVYLACNPYVILDFATFTAEARHVRDWYTPGFSLSGLGAFVWRTLFGAFGLPCVALALAGFLVLWRRYRAWSVATLLVIALYCLFLVHELGSLAGDSKMARLMFAVFPVLAVAAAVGPTLIRNVMARRVTGGVVLFWMGLLAWPYLTGFLLDSNQESTRLRAGEWINQHIPTGSTVAVPASPAPYKLPPFALGNYRLVTDVVARPEYVIRVGESWADPDYVLEHEVATGKGGTPLSFANQPVRIYQRIKLTGSIVEPISRGAD